MLHVLVLLNHSQCGVDEFRAFESKAIEIIRAHGGRLISAFVPQRQSGQQLPDEIHLIEFSDQQAFDRYRNDPRTLALAGERASIISNSVVYVSDEFVSY